MQQLDVDECWVRCTVSPPNAVGSCLREIRRAICLGIRQNFPEVVQVTPLFGRMNSMAITCPMKVSWSKVTSKLMVIQSGMRLGTKQQSWFRISERRVAKFSKLAKQISDAPLTFVCYINCSFLSINFRQWSWLVTVIEEDQVWFFDFLFSRFGFRIFRILYLIFSLHVFWHTVWIT